MVDETAAERYVRLDGTYRKLVSNYRVEVDRAIRYLEFFRPDWSQVTTPIEPRHGRPPRGFDADPPDEEITPALTGWAPSKIITAARLESHLAGLSAAWDELNDAYAAVDEADRKDRPAPAEVHAAATAHVPWPTDQS